MPPSVVAPAAAHGTSTNNTSAANMIKTDFESTHKVLGVLGGGQLGRMMARAAHDMGIKIIALDPQEGSPAGQICHKQIVGDFKDAEKIKDLAAHCDVLTVEIEHVNADAMQKVHETTGTPIHPSPATIKLIQDKYNQKVHLRAHGVPVADFIACGNAEDVKKAGEKFGYPIMLKSRTFAYDGRGNAVVKSEADIEKAINSLVSKDLYVEKWFTFTKELAVMVVRGLDGTLKSYPVVETVQKDNICHTVIAPAQVDGVIQEKAAKMAVEAIASFEGAGIYGVEMFLSAEGEVVVNEIAPRPHNSGHYTIEACYTSQFENHVRAVLGLPLGSCEMKVGAAIMVNILGAGESLDDTWAPFSRALSCEGASLHWYGKQSVKAGRKMGHITLTGACMTEVLKRASDIGLIAPPTEKDFSPVVGIIMGSDSDLPTMKTAARILREFGVPFEVTIVSAHRTPARLFSYAKGARARGIKVLIAAAGGAAHLPGMAAAITPLPVIGVPIPLSYLDGQDSLYSICQMPRGIPVATVAIGNSTNAALLAIRMLGATYPHLLDAMETYMVNMENEVHGKIDKLAEIGWEAYGEKK